MDISGTVSVVCVIELVLDSELILKLKTLNTFNEYSEYLAKKRRMVGCKIK